MVFIQSIVWSQLSLIVVASKVRHIFQSSDEQQREHGWSPRLFCVECSDVVFICPKDIVQMLHRVGGRVSGWRSQDTTLVRSCDIQRLQIASFSDYKHDRRRGVVFFILLIMFVCLLVSPVRMAPPADTWSEVAVYLRFRREEWCCAQRFGDFLMLFGKLLTTFLRVRRA